MAMKELEDLLFETLNQDNEMGRAIKHFERMKRRGAHKRDLERIVEKACRNDGVVRNGLLFAIEKLYSEES